MQIALSPTPTPRRPRLSVVYKDRSDGGADRYYRFFQFSTFQDNRGDNR